MRDSLIAGAAAAALLALPGAAAKDRCNAATETKWTDANVSVEAFASGVDCEKAWAVLAMRDASGEPAYSQVFAVPQNAALAGQTSPAAMEKALKEWVDPSAGPFKTTGDLPEWKEGADFPLLGEFAFYADEGIDRTAYEAIRALKAPIFCFVSGMESMTCLYLDKESGMVVRIGAQSFPG